MTIQEIRKELHQHIGDQVVIKYHLGRNKYESYQVTIKELYDSIFLVEMNHKSLARVKSFSYSDVITNTIRIEY